MRTTQTGLPRTIADSKKLTGRYERQRYDWLSLAGYLMVMAIVTVLVLLQMIPPAAATRSAPAALFSAERAMDHLQKIARAPHPTGSAENERVRDYLFTQLSAMGLKPEIQTSSSVYHDTGKWGIPGPKGMEVGPETWGLAGATVHNVMARIPGTDSSGAVVLAAHYDSVPYGPGASDDGVGVAAILEAARALQAGPSLRNDIILLLTDGEEIGLMGARAFVSHHPWMQDVALVLNLEARGSGGTVLMYETNANNAWIIQEYARSSVAPLTSSVATDVWRMMPNSSDLTLFLEQGKQGMNFAYGENWTAYHTTQDSIKDLDPRSLQHHGANALALAKHFGNLDLSEQPARDAVFFSVLRMGLIVYPKDWAVPLMILALLGYLAVLVIGVRLSRLSLRSVGIGMAAFLCAAAAAVMAGFLVVRLLEMTKAGLLTVGMGGTYNSHWYELGVFAVSLSVCGAIYAAFQRRIRSVDLAMGALFFWLILTIGSTIMLAGASYMFLWPLVAGLLAMTVQLHGKGSGGVFSYITLIIPAIVGLLLAGTVLYLVQLMFGIGILPAGGFLTVLILSLAFPYLNFHSLPRSRILVMLPAVLGFAIIMLTASFTSTQPDQPRLNFTFYSMDADTGKAGWVAQAHMPDTTLEPLLGHSPQEDLLSDYFPTSGNEMILVQDALPIDTPAPQLLVIEDNLKGNERILRLNIRSPRGAYGIMANVAAADAVLAASLYGEQYSRDEPRSEVFFKVIGLPEDGVEIGLVTRIGVPVTIQLADISPGLPLTDEQRAAFESGLRSGYGGGHGIDSMTLIHRQYQLP